MKSVRSRACAFAMVVCGVALSSAPDAWAGGFVESRKIELAAPSSGAQAGFSLDVEGDRLVFGAPGQRANGALGAAYVYERDASGSWVEVAELQSSNGAFPDGFGTSVSLDGDRVLVGSRLADGGAENSGAAYVFERDAAGVWSEVAWLTHPGAENDRLGTAVALDGDTAFVSAPQGTGNSAGTGVVYIYERDASGAWARTQRLASGTSSDGDFFGISLSLDGSRALVQATREGNGVVYVAERDAGGVWSLASRIEAPASPPRRDVDDFGRSAYLQGDRALIGDPRGTSPGVVRVYERGAAGGWSEVATLTSPNTVAGEFFGTSVVFSGDRAVVGSVADDAGRDSGAAYVFERDAAGAWNEVARLTASDGAEGDRFGDSVGLSADRVVVGAYSVDALETSSGAVYVLDRAPSAADDVATTDEDTPVTFDPLANDIATPAGTIGGIAGFTAGGSAAADGAGVITYTPAGDYFGEETFTYTLTDGADTAAATVTVTVAPVNDAPTVADTSVQVAAGTPASIALSATDVEGDALTYTLTQPANGVVTGDAPDVVYTPDAGFSGEDAFTFTVNDGQADSALATVTVTVTGSENVGPVFVAPTPESGSSLAARVGEELTFTLAATDADDGPAPVTYAIVGAPSSASLDAATGAFTWTPGAGDVDEVGATWALRATDGVATAVRDVTVSVSPGEGGGGEDAGGDPDAGGDTDAGDAEYALGADDEGCCATAPASPRSPALAWLALIGLVGWARRRR